MQEKAWFLAPNCMKIHGFRQAVGKYKRKLQAGEWSAVIRLPNFRID